MKPYGKARRLVERITEVAGRGAAAQITVGLTRPLVGANTRERSSWVREVVATMDALLPEEQRREIMALRRCPLPKIGVARDQELRARRDDLSDFVRRVRERGWKGYECEGNRLRIHDFLGSLLVHPQRLRRGADRQDALSLLGGPPCAGDCSRPECPDRRVRDCRDGVPGRGARTRVTLKNDRSWDRCPTAAWPRYAYQLRRHDGCDQQESVPWCHQ